MRCFGAQFETGILNHPTLANGRRTQILTLAFLELHRKADHMSDALLRLIALLGDSSLADGVKSFLNILKEALVRESKFSSVAGGMLIYLR